MIEELCRQKSNNKSIVFHIKCASVAFVLFRNFKKLEKSMEHV